MIPTLSPLRRSLSRLRPRRAVLSALLCGLLVACTGTEESVADVRVALLTGGGSNLGYVTSSLTTPVASAYVPVSDLGTDNRGVDLATLNTGRNLALTRVQGLEQRGSDLLSPVPFAALPTSLAAPCLTQTAQSPTRDRLLTLSDCSGTQQLALYRSDRTLVWTALLPTPPLPIQTPDTPPVRVAVLGDAAVVARPALAGGSEVIRVVPYTTGDPARDVLGNVSDPLPSPNIRDLATFGSTIYAATDTGVRPLLANGLPDASTTEKSVVAYGNGRVDRLWSGVAGSKSLMAAWRDTALSGNSTEPLRLWDGAATTAATALSVGSLRDLSFDLNGQMYLLTPNSLTRYDALVSLQQGYWSGTTLNASLNNATSLTWLIP